jgi:hypothetical protein
MQENMNKVVTICPNSVVKTRKVDPENIHPSINADPSRIHKRKNITNKPLYQVKDKRAHSNKEQ